MPTTTRRRVPLAALMFAVAAAVVSVAAPASAEPILPINYQVEATTTLVGVAFLGL